MGRARSFRSPHHALRPVRPTLLLLALALAAGCATAPPPEPVGLAAEIPGTSWSVERAVEADGDLRRGRGEGIAFGTEGAIRLDGCNDCTGRYAIADSVLTVPPGLGCTRQACPTSSLPLGAIVEGTTTLRRDGLYLVLRNDSLNDELMMVPAR